MIIKCICFLTVYFMSYACYAAVPRVTVSIAPLHSAASAVMKGVGQPELLMSPSLSVHGYQLKPSKMQKLAETDILFWGGRDLESFLPKAIEAAGLEGRNIAVLEDKRIKLYPARTGGVWDNHDDGSENRKTGAVDPHFWLLPENMGASALIIADVLGEKDPENRVVYHENAKRYQREMEQLQNQISQEMKQEQGKPYFVFHDAYQYFEKAAALPAVGAVVADAHHAGGAARLRDLRQKISRLGPVCLFTEPQMPDKYVNTVQEGLPVFKGVLDPLGENIKIGEDFYAQLIHNLARSLQTCLSQIPKD